MNRFITNILSALLIITIGVLGVLSISVWVTAPVTNDNFCNVGPEADLSTSSGVVISSPHITCIEDMLPYDNGEYLMYVAPVYTYLMGRHVVGFI